MVKGVEIHRTTDARAAAAVCCALAMTAILLGSPSPTAAQEADDMEGTAGVTVAERPLATRAQLEAQLESLERLREEEGARGDAEDAEDGTRSIAQRIEKIRERLRAGDFRSGDLVELRVIGDSDLTGTFTVNRNLALDLGTLPPISLEGVLYSEVEEALQEAISQYVREPSVRARALMRVAVVGGVSNPGFYDLAPTATLSEALMQAGGPSQGAKLDEMEYRRGGMDLLDRREAAEQPVETLTLAELGAQRGDQLVVPPGGGQGSFMTVLGVVSGISGVAWAVTRVF